MRISIKHRKDKLDELQFYQDAMALWDDCWEDCDILMKDPRGRELAKQLTNAVGSVCANIEEGYGRGFGKEYPHFLRISRGSARESKGHYLRSKFLLPKSTIEDRVERLESIGARITKTIGTLESKRR